MNDAAAASPPARIVLARPDDWHLHLREGARLNSALAFSARQFARAIVMPNLPEPVTTAERLRRYRAEILAALPADSDFRPLMTLYLTDETTPHTIREAAADATACKWYPAGATTHSAKGVRDFRKLYPALEAMRDAGLPLLVHGETADADVDVFDREEFFLDNVLSRARADFPELKIVVEHISTQAAVRFVEENKNTAATVTAHHLLASRNDMLAGGIRPHYYCAPILKRRADMEALRAAATGASGKFFLGTDSAPHAICEKESPCGCAGVFSAPFALELYATVFEECGALHRLEKFASFNGPDFYGMPRNKTTITLEKTPQTIPETFSFGETEAVPFLAGKTIPWRLQ